MEPECDAAEMSLWLWSRAEQSRVQMNAMNIYWSCFLLFIGGPRNCTLPDLATLWMVIWDSAIFCSSWGRSGSSAKKHAPTGGRMGLWFRVYDGICEVKKKSFIVTGHGCAILLQCCSKKTDHQNFSQFQSILVPFTCRPTLTFLQTSVCLFVSSIATESVCLTFTQ